MAIKVPLPDGTTVEFLDLPPHVAGFCVGCGKVCEVDDGHETCTDGSVACSWQCHSSWHLGSYCALVGLS